MASSSHNNRAMGPSTSNNSVEARRNPARESKAWAGMMMSASLSDDSDSDSDDERLRPAPSARRPSAAGSSAISPSDSGASGGTGSRASWSQRAAAVGSRPPDTASQNPPTLKLLALKSVKEGGAPLGSTYEQPPVSPAVSMRQQIERRQQEEIRKREQTLLVEQQREAARNRTPSPVPPVGYASNSPEKVSNDQLLVKSSTNYGDDIDRHGSMINFGGTDGFGSSADDGMPSGRGIALRDDGPPQQQATQMRPPMHTLPPPRNPYDDEPLTPRTQLTQQLGLSNPHARPPSPATQSRTTASNSPTRSLVSASTSSSGASPPHRPTHVGGGMPRALMPGPGVRPRDDNIPLHRGQPPAQINTMSNGQRLGPPPPQPIPLPSPTYPKMPEPRAAAYDSLTQGNTTNRGFSDAPPSNAPVRRPSLFRRSKAFLLGGEQGRPRQGAMPGNGQQQRRSLFRRSMAFISGQRPQPAAQAQQNPGYDDDSNAPAPRVRGFVDEKPKDRSSIYMGGSGMGDEWDFQGYGAKFWKRFSVAQRKLQDGEFADADRIRAKTQKRRKWTMIISLLGGVTIIMAVVAIVIWRENVKSSDVPGALDREQNGAGTDLDQQMSSSSAAAAAAAATATQNGSASSPTTAAGGTTSNTDDTGDGTSTTRRRRKKKKNKNNDDGSRRKRQESSEAIVDVVRRQVESFVPSTPLMEPVDNVHRRLEKSSASNMVRRKQHRRAAITQAVSGATA